MEDGTWELIKGIMSWVIYPIATVLGYLLKKQLTEMDMLKKEVSDLKISHAVDKSQIQDIKESIRDLTIDIKESQKTIIEDLKSLKDDILEIYQLRK